MTFVILLSVVSLVVAAVGCALIWGYDMRRAEEIERGFPPPQPSPELQGSELHGLESRPTA